MYLLILPIQQHQMPHNPNNPLILHPILRIRIIQPPRKCLIQHRSQPRHQHADPRPATQPQPVVHDDTAAEGVECYRAGEEEEGVRVECCNIRITLAKRRIS